MGSVKRVQPANGKNKNYIHGDTKPIMINRIWWIKQKFIFIRNRKIYFNWLLRLEQRGRDDKELVRYTMENICWWDGFAW